MGVKLEIHQKGCWLNAPAYWLNRRNDSLECKPKYAASLLINNPQNLFHIALMKKIWTAMSLIMTNHGSPQRFDMLVYLYLKTKAKEEMLAEWRKIEINRRILLCALGTRPSSIIVNLSEMILSVFTLFPDGDGSNSCVCFYKWIENVILSLFHK